jgi:hypothetical protein
MIECHRRKNNQDKKDFQKMRTNYDKSKFYLFLSSNTKHENQRKELKICKT